MAQQIQEIMTTRLHAIARSETIREAAKMMRAHEIGDVLVTNPDGTLFGIVTDRDIVVRADAQARDLETTPVEEIASTDIARLGPTATIEEAVRVMRERAVRRLPVVADGMPVGMVSIGDLARERDPDSALATISAAPANR